MYDIFYVSKLQGSDTDWESLKARYPTAQRLTYVKSWDEISNKSFTKMFWIIWDDIDLLDSFNLTDYRATKWDDMYVHCFKNGNHFDGVGLFPKSIKISNREFHHRFYTDKKEVDIEASKPKQFNVYSPINYEEYESISDEMFWIKWSETEIINDDVLKMYISHHDTYDRRENHIFKNACNDSYSFVGGLILCSKYKPISKKEFTAKYVVDKKEHDIIATRYRYPRYTVKSYDQYLEILKKESQSMFWCIWPELVITDETVFDFYFDPFDGSNDFDRNITNVFKNSFNGEDTFVNGLALFSTTTTITKKEFDHRFIIEKKCQDRTVTKHRLYDVVFISYDETNADSNYQQLLEICPRAKRVHGIKGIHNAHKQAAGLCDTDMFWVVDGDAQVVKDFNFDLVMSSYDTDCVHVWRSRNPINDLEYGNGGIKLLPRVLTLEMNTETTDMTTSISKKFKSMPSVSNINSFNTDEFTTWRSAFRECCKLSSRVIARQYEEETQHSLDTWCTTGEDRPFGNYAILGAKAGRAFGEKNKNNLDELKKINDFQWLKTEFDNVK